MVSFTRGAVVNINYRERHMIVKPLHRSFSFFLRGRGMSANGSAHKSVHLLTLFPVARSYAIACAPMTLSIPCRFPFSISLLPPPRRHGPEQQRQRKRDCKAAVQGLAATNERLVSARVGVLGMVAAAVPFVMFEVFLWRCTRLIWSCAGAGDCDPPTRALSPVMPCASIAWLQPLHGPLQWRVHCQP
jgi:hypothetical protein